MGSNRKWVVTAYVALGFLIWVLIDKFLSWLLELVGQTAWNVELIGESFTLSTLIGLVVACASLFLAFRHEELNTVSSEIVVELKKVTWPTMSETRGATIVVIVTVFIMAAFLGLFDFLWSTVMDWLYPSSRSM